MGVKLLKKGDIELGKIVTFIIVAVVLIVVVAFFLGGATGVTKAIKGVFFGVTAGSDITLATANCKQYCENAKTLETKSDKEKSAYCTRYELIDQDHDGEADYAGASKEKEYVHWYCPPLTKFVSGDTGTVGRIEYLDIPCDLKDKDEEIKCPIPR